MSKCSQWSKMAAKVIYEAYPDYDVLPIEPPKPSESIRDFAIRAGMPVIPYSCSSAARRTTISTLRSTWPDWTGQSVISRACVTLSRSWPAQNPSPERTLSNSPSTNAISN